jgi:hypothetical protein
MDEADISHQVLQEVILQTKIQTKLRREEELWRVREFLAPSWSLQFKIFP